MGCVLPAGQGQAPARQAGFAGGLGEEVPATTVNKMCGSGMKTTMMGFDQIALGNTDTVVTGGMESMSNAPYLLEKMRSGARIGHQKVIDHMFLDGLEDAYDKVASWAPSQKIAPRNTSSPAPHKTITP
jgi:acetyl-CoA C-acetyltransferase